MSAETQRARFWTREQAGLAAPDLGRLAIRRDVVTGITFHCTGSPALDPVAKWRQIQQLAMLGKLPSRDLYGDQPYNAGIVLTGAFAGVILPGRDLKYVGAHAASTDNVANRTTLGVAVIGDGSILSAAGWEAIEALVYVWAFGVYKRGLQPFDHLDWRAAGGITTACPGPAVIARVAAMKRAQRT